MTAARSRHAALSGSQTKAPGFAGGYLLPRSETHLMLFAVLTAQCGDAGCAIPRGPGSPGGCDHDPDSRSWTSAKQKNLGCEPLGQALLVTPRGWRVLRWGASGSRAKARCTETLGSNHVIERGTMLLPTPNSNPRIGCRLSTCRLTPAISSPPNPALNG